MELALVLIILVVALVLFISEIIPLDATALVILGSLLVTRLVTPEEAVSGFSNPATIAVGAMFVLSGMFLKTGLAERLSAKLIKSNRRPLVLFVSILIVVALLSAFINNTPVVAILLPMVIAKSNVIMPSKILIPISYISQAGGVCTLIGTSTNLLVNSMGMKSGLSSFEFFEFGQLGIILVLTAVLYFVLIGRFLLPEQRKDSLADLYELRDYISEFLVLEDSPLIGQTVQSSELFKNYPVVLLKQIRGEKTLTFWDAAPVEEGDILLLKGKLEQLMSLREPFKIEVEPKFQLEDKALVSEDLVLMEVMVPSGSKLIRKTLRSLAFQDRYNMVVLGIQSRGHTLHEKLNSTPLKVGDILLLEGRQEDIAKIKRDFDFVVLADFPAIGKPRKHVWLPLAIFGGVIALVFFNIFSIMEAAILGCVAAVLTRCISLQEAYDSINWKVIFMLAGTIPLGIALENTGGANLMAQWAIDLSSGLGPIGVLSMIYITTAVLSEFLSNNTAAILLSPIAISTARSLGVSEVPMLIAVAFAASTCFSSPIGYQTNTMVYSAGGYKYIDFLRVGLPLNLLFWIISTFLIPYFWPF